MLRLLEVQPGDKVLDVGSGSGWTTVLLAHLTGPEGSVTGVEPHRDLAAIAARRTSRLDNVDVVVGEAQNLPSGNASVDMMQARWAYYFGPGCEPGLAQLDRVMRKGAVAFVIDNDATRSTFENREDLESVVRIEFASGPADQIIAQHSGIEVDYAVNLWWRRY